MPRRPSKDLFLLVKSFSESEWETFWRINHQNQWQHPKAKTELPLVYRFILALREMEEYDEEELKVKLEVQPNSQRLKKLKIRGEELIQEIIERTLENKTEARFAQKLPMIIEEYLSRGAYERAKTLVKRYLPVAEEAEAIETQFQLLEYQLHIERQLGSDDFGVESRAISQRRSLLAKQLEEVGAMTHIYESIRAIFHKKDQGSEEKLLKLESSPWFVEDRLTTVRARVLFWESKRILYARKGKFEDSILAARQIQRLAEEFDLGIKDYLILEISVRAVGMEISFAVYSGKIDEAIELFQKLVNLKIRFPIKVPSQLEEVMLRRELVIERAKLDPRGIGNIIAKGWQYFKKRGFPISKRNCFYFCYYAAEASLVTGNLSNSMKWFNFVRTKRPSQFKPELSLIAHLASLLIRMRESDFHGTEYLYKQSRKFCKEYARGNQLAESILNYTKNWLSGGGVPFPKKRFERFLAELELILVDKEYKRWNNYFPFRAYFKSLVSNIELLNILKEEEKS